MPGRINNFPAALAIACSFLTALPTPSVEWTPSRLRYVPLAMPVAGAVVGTLGGLLFSALCFWDVSSMLRAAIMTFFYMAVTGGLHMDGFMDTCDAVFSRKGRRERLEILSDTHVGAFAVMGCGAVLMLKAGIFSELFARPAPFTSYVVLTAAIPVYSRFGLGLLFFLPFAKEDGLARTLGSERVFSDRSVLWAGCALFGLAAAWAAGMKWLFVPFAGGAALVFYGRYCVKKFGGVTGDLMGAYVELSETLMFLTIIIVEQHGRI